MKTFGVLISALLIASPAIAQDVENMPVSRTMAGSTTRAESDTRRTGDTNQAGERLICRRMQQQTTSRMGNPRVCHTEAEWRAISRQAPGG